MIRVKHDRQADAAYIYLTEIKPGEVVRTYPCDPQGVDGMINLDFDAAGCLVGVEVLGASRKLPASLLKDS